MSCSFFNIPYSWYSADGVENLVQLDEDFSDGGWKITSSVNAVEKLMKYNKNVRSSSGDGDTSSGKDDESKKKKEEEPPKKATTTFIAPSLIYMGRKQNATDSPSFITAFWVCPTGSGKSRFMSAAVGKTPFSFPRWLMHINLNNFLDQDTFLLCGQHRAVLTKEAEGYLQTMGGVGRPNDVRKSTYVYRSPSERLPVRIGRFFDETLARVPNRKEGIMAWYNRNTNNGKLFEAWPPREEVLDRYEQHTKVCQDSLDVVERCDKVMKMSKVVGLALAFMKMVLVRSRGGALLQHVPTIPLSSGGISILAATGQMFAQSTSFISCLANRIISSLLRDKSFYSILALAFASYSVASRIKREFFFKFNEQLHRKDIEFIAKNWVDL